MSHITTYAVTALVALGLSSAYLLDGPSELQAAIDTAAAARQAQQQAQAQARFDRAAQAVCGENAGWQLRADGAVQCFTKRGHKTITARVQP
jgi:uncharacterized low-complexity protein